MKNKQRTGRPPKEYKFITPSGEVVTTIGLKELCDKNGLSVPRMSAVHSGKNNHHKGWRAFNVKPKSNYSRKTTVTVEIPRDAMALAKRSAKEKNMPVEEYIADMIELTAGGYIDL
ncbi:HNH endonuclease [Vibrio phage H188]|nr:HNH endonuclease [Vibrio phage H188]